MQKIIYHCDLCKKEVPQRGWDDALTKLTIITNTSSTNPMAELNNQFQGNEFILTEVCDPCQRAIAKACLDALKSRMP